MVFEKIAEIIATQFDVDVDSISMETSFVDDLKADSLDVVEIIMAIEDEYSIEVPDEKLENVKTVGDVVGYIEELVD